MTFNWLLALYAGCGFVIGIACNEYSLRNVTRDSVITLNEWAAYTGKVSHQPVPPAFALTWERATTLRSVALGVLTAAFFVVAAHRFGPARISHLFPAWVMIALSVASAATDMQTYQLPDKLTQPLLWIGLAASALGTTVSPQSAICGAVGGYSALFLVALFSRWMRGSDSGLGAADKKFLAAMGAWTGVEGLLWVIGWASFFGLLHLFIVRFTGRGLPDAAYAGATEPEPARTVHSQAVAGRSVHGDTGRITNDRHYTATACAATEGTALLHAGADANDSNDVVPRNTGLKDAVPYSADVGYAGGSDAGTDRPVRGCTVADGADPTTTDPAVNGLGNNGRFPAGPVLTVLYRAGSGNAGDDGMEPANTVLAGHGHHETEHLDVDTAQNARLRVGPDSADHSEAVHDVIVPHPSAPRCAVGSFNDNDHTVRNATGSWGTGHGLDAHYQPGHDGTGVAGAGHDFAGSEMNRSRLGVTGPNGPAKADHDSAGHDSDDIVGPVRDYFATPSTVSDRAGHESAGNGYPIPFGPAIALAAILVFLR